MERRDVLKLGALAATKVLLGQSSVEAMMSKHDVYRNFDGKIPKRKLGKTGVELSIIGMGGLALAGTEQEKANTIVADAIASGINYFDVAPSYADAQQRLCPALKPFRDNSFLACKSTMRDKAGLERELNESLKALETDHFDLYQLHAIKDVEKDVKAVFAKDGAMEAIIKAKKEGKLKYIGFTAHSAEAALAAMHAFEFDTIMYPINFACHFRNGFENEVLAEAKKQNMGILAIKAMAQQQWPKGAEKKYKNCWYEPIEDAGLARLALSWSLSQGITSALPPADEKLFRLAIELAPQCKPLNNDELAILRQRADQANPLFPLG